MSNKPEQSRPFTPRSLTQKEQQDMQIMLYKLTKLVIKTRDAQTRYFKSKGSGFILDEARKCERDLDAQASACNKFLLEQQGSLF